MTAILGYTNILAKRGSIAPTVTTTGTWANADDIAEPVLGLAAKMTGASGTITITLGTAKSVSVVGLLGIEDLDVGATIQFRDQADFLFASITWNPVEGQTDAVIELPNARSMSAMKITLGSAGTGDHWFGCAWASPIVKQSQKSGWGIEKIGTAKTERIGAIDYTTPAPSIDVYSAQIKTATNAETFAVLDALRASQDYQILYIPTTDSGWMERTTIYGKVDRWSQTHREASVSDFRIRVTEQK